MEADIELWEDPTLKLTSTLPTYRRSSEYGRTMRTTTPAIAAKAIAMLASEIDGWDPQPPVNTNAHVSYSTDIPPIPPRRSLRGTDPQINAEDMSPTASKSKSITKAPAAQPKKKRTLPKPQLAPSCTVHVPAAQPRKKRNLPKPQASVGKSI